MGKLSKKLLMKIATSGIYDWYIDSVNGNDANSGKTAAQALATIGAIPSIVAGTKIGLAKGSTWREQLTIAADNVTVRAYGSGSAPILDCADIISAGWSKTGGRTNIYQVTLTTNYIASEPSFASVWEDSARLPLAASLDACDATAGTYYCADANTTSPVIYVHATGSGNPAVNGKVYEMTTRLAGIYAYGYNSGVIDGVVCQRNYSNGGSIKVGRSWRILNSTAKDGNKHNIYIGDGCYLDDVIADEAYFGTETSTMYVYNEDTPAGLGITFQNCVAQLAAHSDYIAGWYGHNNVSGTFGTINLIDCTSTNCNVSFDGNHASQLNYTRCAANGGTIGWYAQTNVALTNCTFNGKAATAARLMDIFGDSLSVTIDGMTAVFGAHYSASAIRNASGGNNLAIDIAGLSINESGSGTSTIQITGTGGTLKLRNCDFNSLVYTIYSISAGGPTVDSDYNTFWNAGIAFTIDGTPYANLAAVQAAGQETHSVVG